MTYKRANYKFSFRVELVTLAYKTEWLKMLWMKPIKGKVV